MMAAAAATVAAVGVGVTWNAILSSGETVTGEGGRREGVCVCVTG